MVSRGLLSGTSARDEDGEGRECGVTTGVELNHSGPYVGYGKGRKKRERERRKREAESKRQSEEVEVKGVVGRLVEAEEVS